MGWTSFHLNQPVKEWFKRTWEEGGTKEVLDSALVKRTTLYAAIRVKATGEVFCAVYLIRWSRDYNNFTYKDMTEHSGPCEKECPMRIMKLLTPLKDSEDNRYAIEWRERVYKYWSQRRKLNAVLGIIKTESPISFSNGASYQFFKKEGKKVYAGEMQNGEFKSLLWVRFNPARYNFEIV